MLVYPGHCLVLKTFIWPGMHKYIEDYCNKWHEFQICKKKINKKYGLLPEKKGEVTEWIRVNVDL